jgi:hypothetical protein
MKFILKTICIFTLFLSTSFATIINVPADIDSIQGGINLAVDGDTVLVQPGTYYEYINFNGKNIVVGSLTLTTGDTSYISQTVIDADSSNGLVSVVTFENGEDSTAILSGFTITNGNGNIIFQSPYTAGGGINIENSGPTLSHLLIKNNELAFTLESTGTGGGIYCKNSNSVLSDVLIKYNYGAKGAGLYCDSSNLSLSNVIVSNNLTLGHPDDENGGGIYFTNSNPTLVNVKVIGNDGGYGAGGGIFCNNSSPSFSNVTISNNFVQHKGGGIYFADGPNNAFFDSINRCNIYNNYSNHKGKDLYSECDSIISIVVDTFTVLNPDTTYAYPLNKFTFNILHDSLGSPSRIKGKNKIPFEYNFKQNYPNPFNPSTTIEFTLPKSESTTLKVYNILGKEVKTIVSKKLNQGNHTYTFDGKNLASGIYYYQLIAGDYREVKKMILLK